MKSSSRLAVAAIGAALLFAASSAPASGVDFKDPRRALGREDDIRVDAELTQDTVSTSSPIAITYQIQNLTASPIAVADKVCEAAFDPETDTITISIGAEIPAGTAMPHLVTIAPGHTRSLRTGTMVQIIHANPRSPWIRVPRYVQITVNVLRDLEPFAKLIDQQSLASVVPLPDDLFEQWADSVASVPLNSLPVRWTNSGGAGTTEASHAAAGSVY